MPRTTMTVSEAERLLDILTAVLQNDRYPRGQRPVSALHGFDIFDVMTALKLRIANEFLQLSGRPDFDQQFAEGLKLYDGVPWSVMSMFVADDQLGQIGARRVMSAVDPATMQLDKRLASIETGSSFGDFCKALGRNEADYWKHVYQRIGIDYTSDSPRGNRPVEVQPLECNQRPTMNQLFVRFYVIWSIAAVMLVYAAVQRHPYTFYTLLRWICCPIFAYSAVSAHESKCVPWTWIFGALAVVYNPIFRVHLDRSTWIGVNWFTVGVIVIASIVFWRSSRKA
jgi:hypothetical protein